MNPSRHNRSTLNSLTIAVVATLSLFPIAAFAQRGGDAQLDPVVVTASRSEQSLEKTLAAVTVIDREDIDRLEPDSLPELLHRIPGVSISNNGGFGKESSLFLRGAEADQTLVLIDGVRVASATAGKAALQDIPVDQIERIEVVRGPYSSLYGSDAIGGVIQIFTRRPRARPRSTAASPSAATTRAAPARASAVVVSAAGLRSSWRIKVLTASMPAEAMAPPSSLAVTSTSRIAMATETTHCR